MQHEDLICLSEGVFSFQGLQLSIADLEFLKAEALKSQLKRARFCIHRSIYEPTQEMFVCMARNSPKGIYSYPRDASIYLIEGEYRVDFFSEEGEITKTLSVNNQKPFLRMPANQYHHPTLLSDFVIVHEIHQGPWSKEYVKPMPIPKGFTG